MGLFFPSATFTIADELLADTYAFGSSDSRHTRDAKSPADSSTTDAHESQAPRLDPERTRELLVEARDRAHGRRKLRRVAGEDTTCWRPAVLIGASALMLVALIGVVAGARFTHRHASPGPDVAIRGRVRPHDRRARSHQPHRRWVPRPTSQPTASAAVPDPRRVAAKTAAPSARQLPVSPILTRTRPLPPTPPGGEFIIGGP